MYPNRHHQPSSISYQKHPRSPPIFPFFSLQLGHCGGQREGQGGHTHHRSRGGIRDNTRSTRGGARGGSASGSAGGGASGGRVGGVIVGGGAWERKGGGGEEGEEVEEVEEAEEGGKEGKT